MNQHERAIQHRTDELCAYWLIQAAVPQFRAVPLAANF
jgi:hypothetical protein